jgi:5-methyltetrahydrofolate--homocysteine methyltransferase
VLDRPLDQVPARSDVAVDNVVTVLDERATSSVSGTDGDLDGMLRDQAYRGSRYSFGYPACPDLEDREKLVRLLAPERIGVHLSEELQLHPEQSTDALVVHHPEANAR